MDCNSIIYDCVRNIESDTGPRPIGFNIEDSIICGVIAKIEKYIEDINPCNVIFIAFDGVAPYAKMEQQRMRRHKTGYLSEVGRKSDNFGVERKIQTPDVNEGGDLNGRNEVILPPCWNTSAITPGTQFMNMLSLRVKRAFVESGRYFGSKTVIVSGSDEPGEGEHKMFQYMRENVMKSETIAVYGLDADLIMLSIFHCFACENIYIFRESPEFGKAFLDNAFARDELLYLDNRVLAHAILNEMGSHSESKESIGRIYDYVFACFLLGNDG
jgi:5'-3' exoribonuclease 1